MGRSRVCAGEAFAALAALAQIVLLQLCTTAPQSFLTIPNEFAIIQGACFPVFIWGSMMKRLTLSFLFELFSSHPCIVW